VQVKFGMIGLTESVAYEVGNYDIRVMTVCPGEVATKIQKDVDSHYCELNKHKMLSPKTVAVKITDTVFDDKKYRNGASVDLPDLKNDFEKSL